MGNEKKHDFQRSLVKGKKGESQFYALFEDVLTRESGYIADFIITATGDGVEVKSDSYDPSKTENYFMERYSYGDKVGGPWQSLEKGIKYFVYFFPMCNMIYVFNTAALVRRLDKITEGQYIINIGNTSHTTRGFKVKRSDLADLELDIETVFGLKGRKGA
jgi:hypothetical protein